MKGGTSPEVPKARESRGEPRVERVRGSGPCRGVIERPGGSRHDSLSVPIVRGMPLGLGCEACLTIVHAYKELFSI